VEDFKVVEHAQELDVQVLLVLLQLGVAIHLDAQVVAGLLPVQFAVGHMEKVLVAGLAFLGDLHQSDAGGYLVLLLHPVGDHIVRGRPREAPNAGNLDGLQVQQIERGRLVNVDRVLAHTGHKLVVVRPAEHGKHRHAIGHKRTLLGSGADVPDYNLLSRGRWSVSDEIIFARRKLHELGAGMGELLDLLETTAAPDGDAGLVESDHIRAQGRPLDEGVGEAFAGLQLEGFGKDVLPEANLHAVGRGFRSHAVLVIGIRVVDEVVQIALYLEGLHGWRLPLLRDVLVPREMGILAIAFNYSP